VGGRGVAQAGPCRPPHALLAPLPALGLSASPMTRGHGGMWTCS
jgi:hypothetical protein